MQPADFALTEGSNNGKKQQRELCQYFRVCAIQKLKIHLIARPILAKICQRKRSRDREKQIAPPLLYFRNQDSLIDLFYKLPAPYFTKFRHFPNSIQLDIAETVPGCIRCNWQYSDVLVPFKNCRKLLIRSYSPDVRITEFRFRFAFR